MSTSATVPIIAPDNSTWDVPVERVHEAINAGGRLMGASSPSAPPPISMEESSVPKIVRSAASTLPVAGGMAGGIIGAGGLAGFGAPVGAGLGAAGGELARQAIDTSLGDKFIGPAQSVKQAALAGGIAAGSEGLGSAAAGLGNRAISRIAASQAAKESGNAAEGITNAAPVAVTGKGLLRSLQSAYDDLSAKLGDIFQGSTSTTSLNAALVNARAAAAQSGLKGIPRKFEDIIQAAKELNGIQGDQVTADQLFNFQKSLAGGNLYGSNLRPGVGAVLRNISKNAYSDIAGHLTNLTPEAAPILKQLTNLHAARSAVEGYGPGSIASSFITAATHPKTTAVLSPLATAAAIQSSDKARDITNRALMETIP